MGSAHGAGNLGTFIGPAGLALIAGSSNFVSPEATANALIPAMNYFTGLYILALIAVLFRARLVARRVDLYLDTLYSAFEMIASGITTVQHLHGWVPGGLAAVEAGADEVIRAYEDIGMRVSYSFALRDQNRLVYQNDEERLHAKHHNKERVKIQLAPANLHWCSDPALEMLADYSRRYDAPMHMHLVETAYQKEYARRRGGGTALDYIDRFGFLGPRLTLGHGVWLNEADLDRIAATGTHICHNCSSNFRLRSGVAPLNAFEQRGIDTAIGLDEAGINDDRDMLQEMRMVLRAHRSPGLDEDDVPSTGQVLRMATTGGAMTTPFGSRIGSLAVGKSADLVLINWDKIAYPYLDPETSILDAVVQRGKTDAVDLVMVAGEVICEGGRFTRVDRDAALRDLHQSLRHPLVADEIERRRLSKALLPHVRRFYAGYFDPETHLPYYRPSSRV